MRLENTWQEIRDHSFIQNHSRSFRFTAPWRCCFSSVHLTHFQQGSGQRTGMAIAEAESFFFFFIWPQKPVTFEVPVVSDNWICWRLFLDERGDSLLKPSRTTYGDVGLFDNFFKGFQTLRLHYFLQFSSCGPWRVFSHSNSPSHHALGWYRHRHIDIYSVDWNLLIITLML